MNIDHPIALATSTPDATPFTLASKRCRVEGAQADGVKRIIMDSGETIVPAHSMEARCISFRASPLGIERTLRVAGGDVVETIVVAPDAAVAVMDWSGARTEQYVYGARDHEVDPEAWIRTHNAAAQRRERQQLCIATEDARVARAFEWAKYRLATAGQPLPLQMPDASAQLPDMDDWVRECEVGELGAWPYGPEAVVKSVVRLLGYAPDAERERLQLAPDFPEGMTRFSAENMAIGNALVSLTYDRTATGRTFTIVQVAGPYPVRLIFEPVLPDQRFAPFVDGVAATLDVRPAGDRIVLPVQIMLDEQRVVEFRNV